jgi:hypothetical protein
VAVLMPSEDIWLSVNRISAHAKAFGEDPVRHLMHQAYFDLVTPLVGTDCAAQMNLPQNDHQNWSTAVSDIDLVDVFGPPRAGFFHTAARPEPK